MSRRPKTLRCNVGKVPIPTPVVRPTVLPVTPIATGFALLNAPPPPALNSLHHENRPFTPLLIPTVTPNPVVLTPE